MVLLAVDFSSVTDALTTLVTGLESQHQRLTEAGQELMHKLGLLEVALALLWTMFQGESFRSLLQKAFGLSIWMMIITNFHDLAKSATKWLVVKAGSVAGGGDPWEIVLNPGLIMKMGATASEPLMEKAADVSLLDGGDALMMAICGLLLVFAYIFMAVHVAFTVVEFYLYLNLGALLLPFAALSHTRFIADKAINAVLHTAIKLAVLSYITTAIKPILSAVELHQAFGQRTELTWNDIFSMLLVSTLCLFLSVMAPRLAAGLLHGSPSMSGTAAVVGAVAGASALANTVAKDGYKLGQKAFGSIAAGLQSLGEGIRPAAAAQSAANASTGDSAASAAAAPPTPVTFVYFGNPALSGGNGAAALPAPPKPALDSGGGEMRLGRGDAPQLPPGGAA